MQVLIHKRSSKALYTNNSVLMNLPNLAVLIHHKTEKLENESGKNNII